MNRQSGKVAEKINAVLILFNVRSVFNVGAIFRTADAVGIKKIYLAGYTPTPIDRFGRKRKDFAKCALGAEDFIDWESYKDIDDLLIFLNKKKYKVVALEQDKKSIDYKKYTPKEKTAILIGNEPNGIEQSVLQKCDKIIEIPMSGKKESLNVSVATGVLLYRLLDN